MTTLTVGDRLRQLRRERKLSQTALAKQIDFSQSAVGRLESDPDYQASTRMIEAIAEFFECEAEWLVTGRGDQVSKRVMRKRTELRRKNQDFFASLPREVRSALSQEPFAFIYFKNMEELLLRAINSRVPLSDPEDEEFFQYLLRQWTARRTRGNEAIRKGIKLLGHLGFAELAKHIVTEGLSQTAENADPDLPN